MQELELLEEDSNIYKLIGLVLIKQDPLEATSNVKKRLEFIQGELDRVDSAVKKLEDKQSKRHATVWLYRCTVKPGLQSVNRMSHSCYMHVQLRQIESQVQKIAQAAAQAEADSKGS